MGSLSKEDVMAAILAAQPQPQQPQPQRNVLQRMRDKMMGDGPSVAEYRAYVIDAQTRGEQPMSMDEWAKNRQRNVLRAP